MKSHSIFKQWYLRCSQLYPSSGELLPSFLPYILLNFMPRFFGAALRRRSLLNVYWTGLTAHLFFSIASGIFTIYSMFNEGVSSELTQQCVDDAVDDVTAQFCGNGMTVVKGVIIAFFVVAWLFQLCAYSLYFTSNILLTSAGRWNHYCCQLLRSVRRRKIPIPRHQVRIPTRPYSCHDLQLVWRR
jgi:hypothetical protein